MGGGITAGTAAEISTHYDDLWISIAKSKDGSEKWGILISRGPGHSHKLLLSTTNIFESRESGIACIKSTLETCETYTSQQIEKGEGLLAAVMNPDKLPLEDARKAGLIMTKEHIRAIMEKIESDGATSTWEMDLSPK